ncbi:MAG: hypothetical protein KF729_10710 [Sandaracinaceae bacterium]|nr:hypothetical protein [Sandaracinaceae bacterium]
MPHPRLLASILVLALAGCDGGMEDPLRPDSGVPPGTDGGGGGGSDGGGPPTGDTTYYGHVRPILVENCTMCHQPTGIAPFALQTYEEASEVGERMAEITAARIMPPFLADNSGECQTFSNHRGLTDAEIATIGRWVEQGMLEGDPSTPAPTPSELPSLGTADLTLEMPDTYAIMQGMDDDYRCFVIETGTTADTYVTGYEVHPGNTQRVHHVIVYNPTSDAAAREARNLDATEGAVGDGYQCFGGPRVDAAPMVLWAPGAGATLFPRGTGVQLAAGRAQVVQIHYNNLVRGAPTDDRTRVDLRTASSASPAYIVPLAHTGIVLPPRMASVTQTTSQSLSVLPVPVRAHGMFPHMHTLGRQLRVERTGSSDECLIDVPRWDFNWQLAYWFTRPITIQPSDTVSITCTYNTMSRDDTVRWGDGTQDEMCLNFFYLTL